MFVAASVVAAAPATSDVNMLTVILSVLLMLFLLAMAAFIYMYIQKRL